MTEFDLVEETATGEREFRAGGLNFRSAMLKAAETSLKNETTVDVMDAGGKLRIRFRKGASVLPSQVGVEPAPVEDPLWKRLNDGRESWTHAAGLEG